jgi:hypothetical protein
MQFLKATEAESAGAGTEGDLEIRWAPVRHIVIALNTAGFRPGAFFKTVAYHSAPVEGDVGFTYRF